MKSPSQKGQSTVQIAKVYFHIQVVPKEVGVHKSIILIQDHS